MEKIKSPETAALLPKEATSKLRKWAYIAFLKLTGRSGGNYAGVRMLPRVVLKFGPYQMSEAYAMHYIATHTSIPVPKIYCAFTRTFLNLHGEPETDCFMAMERIKGHILRSEWHKMTALQQESVLKQLRSYMDELRSLSPPRDGEVGSVDYGPVNDRRVENNGFGPYKTVNDFNTKLGTNYVLDQAIGKEDNPEASAFARKMKSKTWNTRFTHGDLSGFNILVKDGQITAIIDWERSGWLPEFYEYTQAWHVNIWDEWLRPHLPKILETYPDELQMDKMRRDIFPVY